MLVDLEQWEVSEVNSSLEDHVALGTCDLILLIKVSFHESFLKSRELMFC